MLKAPHFPKLNWGFRIGSYTVNAIKNPEKQDFFEWGRLLQLEEVSSLFFKLPIALVIYPFKTPSLSSVVLRFAGFSQDLLEFYAFSSPAYCCVVADDSLSPFNFYTVEGICQGMIYRNELYQLLLEFSAEQIGETSQSSWVFPRCGQIVLSISAHRYRLWGRLRSPFSEMPTQWFHRSPQKSVAPSPDLTLQRFCPTLRVFSIASVVDLLDWLSCSLQQGYTHLLLDLRNVSFMDTMGLSGYPC